MAGEDLEKPDAFLPVKPELRAAFITGIFLLARLMMILGSTLAGLQGYGDFAHFFQLAKLAGWPYLNYWVEFPPVFPFLSTLFYQLSQGREHSYSYLLIFALTLADAGSLNLVYRLADQKWKTWVYLVILISLPYGWWYLDPLAVFAMLTGLYLLLDEKYSRAGFVLGIGFLIKFFPLLAITAVWRKISLRKAILTGLVILATAGTVYAGLWAVSPDYTRASFLSQSMKGSWETPWALIDGNLRTGLFGPVQERLDPAAVSIQRGSPAVIPTWATLIFFVLLGLGGLAFANPQNGRERIGLVGFTWCVFLLWSPGYSPQWVLYLIPLILLALPWRTGLLMLATLILANLLEWPVLLSRGMFWTLPVTVLLRSGLLLLLGILFLQQTLHRPRVDIRAAIGKDGD